MIKCPSKRCEKIYSFIRCSKCHKLIFSKENENIMGNCVKCPYQGCGEYTLISQCIHCKIKAVYSGNQSSFIEGQNVDCPSCKKKYNFYKNNEIFRHYAESLRTCPFSLHLN